MKVNLLDFIRLTLNVSLFTVILTISFRINAIFFDKKTVCDFLILGEFWIGREENKYKK